MWKQLYHVRFWRNIVPQSRPQTFDWSRKTNSFGWRGTLNFALTNFFFFPTKSCGYTETSPWSIFLVIWSMKDDLKLCCTNSSGKYVALSLPLPLCPPAHFSELCLFVSFCWAGNVQLVLKAFSLKNSRLPRLKRSMLDSGDALLSLNIRVCPEKHVALMQEWRPWISEFPHTVPQRPRTAFSISARVVSGLGCSDGSSPGAVRITTPLHYGKQQQIHEW